MFSATLVVFALRTRLPFFKSEPGRAMLLVMLAMAVIVLVLPYSPVAGLLGFEPLTLPVLMAIGANVALHFISAKPAKRWFFRNFRNNN